MRKAIIQNSAAERLALEAQEAQDEIVALRLANEARFGTPIGACPYGCDGGGWNPLATYCWPMIEIEIYYDGQWLTPCECNVASTHLRGVRYRWPRRYPNGYMGKRIMPPDLAA